MKKLIILIFLVSCADPNAELLAKYKNLEIELAKVTNEAGYWKSSNNACNFTVLSLRKDLAWYTCKERNLNEYQRKYLCGEE